MTHNVGECAASAIRAFIRRRQGNGRVLVAGRHPKIMLFYGPTSTLDPEKIKGVVDVMVGLAVASSVLDVWLDVENQTRLKQD